MQNSKIHVRVNRSTAHILAFCCFKAKLRWLSYSVINSDTSKPVQFTTMVLKAIQKWKSCYGSCLPTSWTHAGQLHHLGSYCQVILYGTVFFGVSSWLSNCPNDGSEHNGKKTVASWIPFLHNQTWNSMQKKIDVSTRHQIKMVKLPEHVLHLQLYRWVNVPT